MRPGAGITLADKDIHEQGYYRCNDKKHHKGIQKKAFIFVASDAARHSTRVRNSTTIATALMVTASRRSRTGNNESEHVMKFFVQRTSYSVLIALALGASACESVALMPRPDVDDVSGRRSDRGAARDNRAAETYRGREARGDEIVGTIERVDESAREIRLRTTEGRVMVIKYDPATVVYNRDREVGVDALRNRDQVLIRVSTNSSGDQYADVIRMNDAGSVGSRSY
jgi:hypothetical protein